MLHRPSERRGIAPSRPDEDTNDNASLHRFAVRCAASPSPCGRWAPSPRSRSRRSCPAAPPGSAVATFAGGCFWCMEPPFDKLDGVLSTTSGYTGGTKKNPTYEEVSRGTTGHAEAVQVIYDPTKISYEKLLDVFWHNIDPTVTDRQFCDVGTQYRTAIFVHTDEQRRAAEASKAALEKSKPFKEPIVTQIVAAHATSTRPRNTTRTTTEEPRPLQVLPHRLRPRRAPEGAVGQRAH